MKEFESYLRNEERSHATIEKYVRDVRGFADFAGASEISKQTVLAYKNQLAASYAISSANSMIAALNSFLRFCGWHDLCIRQFKIQRQMYCSAEKELTRAAKEGFSPSPSIFFSPSRRYSYGYLGANIRDISRFPSFPVRTSLVTPPAPTAKML